MDVLSDSVALRSFQNTGEEHARTYAFMEALEDATGLKHTWLEYRAPRMKGAPPRDAEFAVVTPKTADRNGGPFDEMMQALADYRATKGLGPISPWARSRICTAYLKSRTQDKWLASLGISKRDECAGLRADEPSRVEKYAWGSTQAVQHFSPLADAGITKADVMEFWSWQAFDLGIKEYEGNCNVCFLKDESDQSRAISEVSHETAARWIARQEVYPQFGGRRHRGYKTLLEEAPARREIEATLSAGDKPENTHNMEPRRFHLVVIQERKRLKGEVAPFSCNCEGAETLRRMTEEQEDEFVLSLPSDQ